MDRKNTALKLSRAIGGGLSLADVMTFAFGALFTGAKISGGAAGPGIALVCAVSGKRRGLFAAIGTVLGGILGSNYVYGAVGALAFLLRLGLSVLLDGDEKDGKAEPFFARLLTRVGKAELCESVYARMMLSAALTLICGGLELVRSAYSVKLLASAAVSGVLAPILVFLWDELFGKKGESPVRHVAACVTALTAVMGAANIVPFADLSVPLAFAVTLGVTYRHGVTRGVLYGVVVSFGCAPAGSPAFALASLAFAPFGSVSATVGTAFALAASTAWYLYGTGLSAMGSEVPKLIISAALVTPILASGIIKKKELPSVARTDESVTLLLRDSEMRTRMRNLSEGLSSLSEVLYRLSDKLTAPDDDDLSLLCEASFDHYCSKCGMRSACFEKEARATAEMQSAMVAAMKRDGRASAAAVPRELASRCYSMGQIIDSMNAACRRLSSEAKLYDRTAVVAADYELTAKLLEESSHFGIDGVKCDTALTDKLYRALRDVDFTADRVAVFGARQLRVVAKGIDVRATTTGSDDLCRAVSAVCRMPMSPPEFSVDGSCVTMTMKALPRLNVRCGRAGVAMSDVREGKDPAMATRVFNKDRRGLGKTASADCGDVINAFLTDENRFFMLISDGMGSGREAALTSGICAVFIEKLLRAGASMDTSLKMLNSMLRVRGDECSATVDLMELDLMNGEVRFVKSGAAPSFVIRDGRLFRLQSKTVPIGIMRALDAEMIRFEAQKGDVIVMLSDGVAKSFEDCPWLYELLASDEMKIDDAEAMARTVVKCAVQNGAADDVTAGVVVIS